MLSALRRMRASTKSSMLLCLDFDETITLQDTTSLLFQHVSSPAATEQRLVTQYIHDFRVFLEPYETQWHPRSTFDRAGLRSFLKGYGDVDLRSLQRVEECAALGGIRHQDIVAAASTVKLQPNCVETLAIADWKIISANWSAELVRSVLQHAGICEQQIIANDLKMDKSVTTGDVEVKVHTPEDKERWIRKLRAMHVETQPTIVYVGDSANDLLALLEADVGIWFHPNAMKSTAKLMRRLAESYGINVQPLRNSLAECVQDSNVRDDRPVIFTISDWLHLRAIIES